MADPATLDEYNRIFHANTKIEGFGLDVTQVMPCPFCAAPENMRAKVIHCEAAFAKGATCKECGRSWKAIMNRSANGVGFEIVQTGGADPAPYLPPMRRV